ncbi:ribosomal protein S6 glutaminyl transferase [Klebsiella pneumoniae]|uniref:Ribosomal protein S6 glutaminyl transferase n=1 Tax=Klebsiella pneumoniae TaxID=573 RepID=A0A2X3EMU7_KLEPN|nr:ribosomal protein S6 glutaminyl transferase [Klebsiella pneumoniae]
MKIAILSRDGTLYSCRRLREAAQQRGHQIEILDPLSCYMNVSPVASSIHYKGRQLPHFDAVIRALARRSPTMAPRPCASLSSWEAIR